MRAEPFLDTNVLVYAADTTAKEPAKTATALALTSTPSNIVSTQVLGEFYRVVTGAKQKAPLTHGEALRWISVWELFDVRALTLVTVKAALALVARYGIGYYDALILAAAAEAGCSTVYTEDLNDGQRYGAVTVRNPFAPGFVLP